MKKLSFISSVACLLFFTGCLQSETLIKVKSNGTGEVIQTLAMSDEVIELFEGFGKAKFDPFPKKELQEKAATMGPGVTFKKVKKFKKNGFKGAVATYSFKDINTLTIDQSPSSPKDKMEKSEEENKSDDAVKFRLDKNGEGQSVLTILFPEERVSKKSEKLKDKKSPEPTDKDIAELKEFFDGMKIGIAVEVDGKILQHNAPKMEGSRATLLGIDFGALLNSEEQLKELAKLKPKSVEEAEQLLRGIPGMTIPTEEKITIVFQK